MVDQSREMSLTSLDRQYSVRDHFAKSLVLDRFSRLEKGRLNVEMPNGSRLTFGDSQPEATICVHDLSFFGRLLRSADVGAGESYMAGDWGTPDLVALTRLFLDNERHFTPHPLMGLFKRLSDRLLHSARKNTIGRAARNIASHYDLSNELYGLFLDQSMTYSSAYFTSNDDTLGEAQENKYRVIAEKAGIVPGDRVLEIGCGWGGFADFAARTYGCHVTGLTLSNAQADFARKRIRLAGLSDLVDIRIEDYRVTGGIYDAIVSIEMLEAVGHEYLGDFFSACDRLLKPEGRAAIQVITIPDQLYDNYRRGTDFIRRHIFPGGHLPSLQAMQNAIARRSSFVIQEVENIAGHYAETLNRWRSAFMCQLAAVESLGFDRRFCRMWEFYLATCEAAFANGKLATLQLAVARPGRGAARGLGLAQSNCGEKS